MTDTNLCRRRLYWNVNSERYIFFLRPNDSFFHRKFHPVILLCSTASNLSIKLNRIAWYKQLHAIKSCCWTNYTRQRDPFEHKLTTKFKKAAKLIELFHRFPSSIINIFLFMWDNFTIIISLVNRKKKYILIKIKNRQQKPPKIAKQLTLNGHLICFRHWRGRHNKYLINKATSHFLNFLKCKNNLKHPYTWALSSNFLQFLLP